MSEPEYDEVELDAEALAMLAAYRDDERPGADLKARVWERLDQAEAPVIPDEASASAGPRRGWAVAVAVAAAVMLSIVLTQMLPDEVQEHEGARLARAFEHQAEPEAVTRGVVERKDLPASELELEPVPESVPKPETQRNATAKTRRSTPAPKPPAEPLETLAEETRLLERAQAALSAGDPDRALQLVTQSEKAFPDPVLGQERAALRVVALCQAGRIEEGQAAAQRFSSQFPGSALKSRVDAACPP